MIDPLNKVDEIIIRVSNDAWKVVGIQINKGHEITYEDHLSLENAEKLAQTLAEENGVPWDKEDTSLDSEI
jgi:hypothetical protein